MDSSAYIIAIVGYVIVFVALLILYFVFANLPKLLKIITNLQVKRKKNSQSSDNYVGHITGQENAAIATAIFLFFDELHDDESAQMTIKKVKKDYSPWSSRVYTINSFQRK